MIGPRTWESPEGGTRKQEMPIPRDQGPIESFQGRGRPPIRPSERAAGKVDVSEIQRTQSDPESKHLGSSGRRPIFIPC